MKMKLLLFFIFLSTFAVAQNNFDVFFDFNKDIPNETSLLTFRNWIKAHKEFVVIRLSGYCDSVDDNSYNKELAVRRINAVLNLLKENEIQVSEKVEINSMGEDFELSKIQAENRKVTIIVEALNDLVPTPKIEIPQKLSEQVQAAKTGDLIKLEEINFLNNSAQLVTKSKPVLDSLLCVMRDFPKLKIEIQGHVCCRVEGDLNNISTARARAVYVFLLRNGINRKRLSFKGYGISRPKFPIPEKNEEEENENRRVEIKIIEK